MIPLTMACAFCKDLVSYGQAKGFAVTIGILLLVPILLIGGITTWLARAAKRRGSGGDPGGRPRPSGCG